jgi:hypothetical protein
MEYVRYQPMKGRAQLKKEHGMVCAIEGCGKPLTSMRGPGSRKYCVDHQQQDHRLGGLGNSARPHTFHREGICDECGTDVMADVRAKHPGLEESDPDMFLRVVRNRIIGDHQIRRADGGGNNKENVRSLCIVCNADKTILSGDSRKGVIKNIKEAKNCD